MIDIRRLAVLVSVARTGSLTAAAQDLGVTQPAIGQALRALEAQCGVSLVTRAGRGVKLTSAGNTLVSRSMPILAALASAEDELTSMGRGRAGRVKMACMGGAIAPIVAPALAEARRAAAGLDVTLNEFAVSGHFHALEALLRGDNDIAVVAEGMAGVEWPDLHHEVLAEVPVMVLLHREHALASSKAVTAAALADAAIVAVPDTLPLLSAEPFLSMHLEQEKLSVVPDRSSALSLARHQFGAVVLPWPDNEAEPLGELVAVPLDPAMTVRYLAVTRRHFPPSHAMQVVLDALTAQADPEDTPPAP